jgi:hypothetical protein
MTKRRIARIRSMSNPTVGACLYLDPEDLEKLGVDPTNTDRISYRVSSDGELLISQAEADE